MRCHLDAVIGSPSGHDGCHVFDQRCNPGLRCMKTKRWAGQLESDLLISYQPMACAKLIHIHRVEAEGRKALQDFARTTNGWALIQPNVALWWNPHLNSACFVVLGKPGLELKTHYSYRFPANMSCNAVRLPHHRFTLLPDAHANLLQSRVACLSQHVVAALVVRRSNNSLLAVFFFNLLTSD